MIAVASAAQIKAAEEAFFAANPGVDLMQIAAARVAEAAMAMLPDHGHRRVLIAVGPGNNGGDGLFAGRDLAQAGVRVSVWPTADAAHEAGLEAAKAAGCEVVDAARAMALLADTDLVIDAVYGLTGRLGLPPRVALFAEACRDLEVPVLAVDLPSGLVPDSHEVRDAFTSTQTITFGAAKLCHVAQPALSRCGDVHVVDLGFEVGEVDVHQLTPDALASAWPWPTPLDDKYARGVVGIDTGSTRYPGAGVLSCLGAVYSGAGLVRFIGPRRSANLVLARTPSVTLGDGRVQVWLIGSGWGDSDECASRLQHALDGGVPLIVDADALTLLPFELPEGSLLTPHAGELARLLGIERIDVEADPIGAARVAAERYGATVLLKGATNYAMSPEGSVLIAEPGPAWTAQAGSGDVLAGICATLMAAGLEAQLAAACAASLQAIAASEMSGPYPPDVIAEAMPAVLDELSSF